jgi:LacI family transcriptional regulator
MRDVAKLAGVSPMTVSRVVNDDPTVNEALRLRVLKAVDQLRYRPNMMASHFRRRDRRSFTIGFLMPDVANPFFAEVQRAVQELARAHNCDLLSATVDDDGEREKGVIDRLLGRRVEGLILISTTKDHGYLQADVMSGLAVVFLDQPPAFLAADSVVADNRKAAGRAVRHLMTGGHRRIAYLGYLQSAWTNQERYQGYCDALRTRWVPLDPRLVRQDLVTSEMAERATRELLAEENGPTAVFSAWSRSTIGAIKALRNAGRQDATALVGFDDFDAAGLLDPGVTVVAQDPAAFGRLGGEILFRRLGGDRSPMTQHVVRTSLVKRGSGEIPGPYAGPRRTEPRAPSMVFSNR